MHIIIYYAPFTANKQGYHYYLHPIIQQNECLPNKTAIVHQDNSLLNTLEMSSPGSLVFSNKTNICHLICSFPKFTKEFCPDPTPRFPQLCSISLTVDFRRFEGYVDSSCTQNFSCCVGYGHNLV